MKKAIILILSISLILALSAAPVLAGEDSRSYEFDLTVNGEHEVQAEPGDVLTVTLKLKRTDSSEPSEIYGMQDEIRYDDIFLQIVEGGWLTGKGIQTNDLGLIMGGRAFYMNFLSLSGGEEWSAETLIGTFQVVILGESGGSTLKSENCSVSLKDGSGSYAVTANDLVISIKGYSTVTFNPQNGEKTWDVSVKTGEKLTEPEAPGKQGFTFSGWYIDQNQTQKWDFDNDVVEGNMTLFAGWAKGDPIPDDTAPETPEGAPRSSLPPWALISGAGIVILAALLLMLFGGKRITVTLEPGDGSPSTQVRVRKGRKLERPQVPAKQGYRLTGWYRDAAKTQPWKFRTDTVTEPVTLFAGWEEENGDQ